MFGLQFLTTAFFRFIVITITNNSIHDGRLRFNAILVGGGPVALGLYKNMQKQKQHSGTKFIGFVYCNGEKSEELEKLLPCMGFYTD